MSCMEILYQPYSAQTIQQKQLPLLKHNLKFTTDFTKAQRSSERKSPLSGRPTRATASPQICRKISLESDTERQRPVSAFNKFTQPFDNPAILSSTSNKKNLIPQISFIETSHVEENTDTFIRKNNDFSQRAKKGFSECPKKVNIHSTSSQTTFEKPNESNFTPAKKCINSRCVMLQYFVGNSADEVDEHFSRALRKSSTFSKEKLPPMAKRKFPPSFWDCSYQDRPTNLSSVFTPPSHPLHFCSTPFPLYDLLRPQTLLENVSSFSSSNSSLFSKLNFLRSCSSVQGHIQPSFNAVPHSSNNFESPWKTYARLSCSFSGQKLNPYRSSSASMATSSYFSDILKLSSSKFMLHQGAYTPSNVSHQEAAISSSYRDAFKTPFC